MKLTLEEHLELGQRVKEFREALMKSHVLGIGAISSRENRAVHRVLKHIERLKCELDRVVHRDFRHYPDPTAIYYGRSEAWLAQNEEPKNEVKA